MFTKIKFYYYEIAYYLYKARVRCLQKKVDRVLDSCGKMIEMMKTYNNKQRALFQ